MRAKIFFKILKATWNKATHVLILVKAQNVIREAGVHNAVNFCLKRQYLKLEPSCLKVYSTFKFNSSPSMDPNRGLMIPGLHLQSCVPSITHKGASECFQGFLSITKSCEEWKMARQEIFFLSLGDTDPTNSHRERYFMTVLESNKTACSRVTYYFYVCVKTVWSSWRDCSVVKNTCFSSRGHTLHAQHAYGG